MRVHKLLDTVIVATAAFGEHVTYLSRHLNGIKLMMTFPYTHNFVCSPYCSTTIKDTSMECHLCSSLSLSLSLSLPPPSLSHSLPSSLSLPPFPPSPLFPPSCPLSLLTCVVLPSSMSVSNSWSRMVSRNTSSSLH